MTKLDIFHAAKGERVIGNKDLIAQERVVCTLQTFLNYAINILVVWGIHSWIIISNRCKGMVCCVCKEKKMTGKGDVRMPN